MFFEIKSFLETDFDDIKRSTSIKINLTEKDKYKLIGFVCCRKFNHFTFYINDLELNDNYNYDDLRNNDNYYYDDKESDWYFVKITNINDLFNNQQYDITLKNKKL